MPSVDFRDHESGLFLKSEGSCIIMSWGLSDDLTETVPVLREAFGGRGRIGFQPEEWLAK